MGAQQEPYRGDVFNSYNDGPPEPGKPAMGGFYELESLSPAAQLPTGKSLSHTHSTFHIEGDPAALARVAKAALGVDIKTEDIASEKRSDEPLAPDHSLLARVLEPEAMDGERKPAITTRWTTQR